jgi:Protein of unknown function (DUF2510)
MSVPFCPAVEEAMGIGFFPDPQGGQDTLDVRPPWKSQLSAEQRNAVLGVAASVTMRVAEYPQIEHTSVEDSFVADLTKGVNTALGLDMLAWSAAALLRTGLGESLMDATPEPDALTDPGWYVDPLFGKAERYWDGTDWTERCRSPADHGVEGLSPLRR